MVVYKRTHTKQFKLASGCTDDEGRSRGNDEKRTILWHVSVARRGRKIEENTQRARINCIEGGTQATKSNKPNIGELVKRQLHQQQSRPVEA